MLTQPTTHSGAPLLIVLRCLAVIQEEWGVGAWACCDAACHHVKRLAGAIDAAAALGLLESEIIFGAMPCTRRVRPRRFEWNQLVFLLNFPIIFK
jgi:hypothetical protein